MNKKKMIVIGIVCFVALWIIAGVTDFALVYNFKRPICSIIVDPTYDDGGSGHYVGLGYSFDIEGNFVTEDGHRGVTSYRGYILGKEVCRGFWEEMLTEDDKNKLIYGDDLLNFEDNEISINQENGEKLDNTANDDIVISEPPTLTVASWKESIKALKGTSSWQYDNGDGTITAINSDSVHPLEVKKRMPILNLVPSPLSSVDPLLATFHWDVMPDTVLVRCWSEKNWENIDAKSEEVEITKGNENFTIELNYENYIYEVIANWNSSDKYSGTVRYSFCTIKCDEHSQPIE